VVGELQHDAQGRFWVDAVLTLGQMLRGVEPCARSLQLLGRLVVWDTEHNNGVLIYVLLADKYVEIVADRGVDRRVAQDTWEVICRAMESAFREGRFEDGAIDGIAAISELLAQHFPRRAAGPNELPAQP